MLSLMRRPCVVVSHRARDAPRSTRRFACGCGARAESRANRLCGGRGCELILQHVSTDSRDQCLGFWWRVAGKNAAKLVVADVLVHVELRHEGSDHAQTGAGRDTGERSE